MNFYNHQHLYYVSARKDPWFSARARRRGQATGALRAIFRPWPGSSRPLSRSATVLSSVSSTSAWYWLADLCEDQGIPFVLGHLRCT